MKHIDYSAIRASNRWLPKGNAVDEALFDLLFKLSTFHEALVAWIHHPNVQQLEQSLSTLVMCQIPSDLARPLVLQACFLLGSVKFVDSDYEGALPLFRRCVRAQYLLDSSVTFCVACLVQLVRSDLLLFNWTPLIVSDRTNGWKL